MAVGIESLFAWSLVILQGLGKREKNENRSSKRHREA